MNDTVTNNDLWSLTELARMLGVKQSALSNWKKRYADFPQPATGGGPGRQALYSGSEFKLWHAQRIRQRYGTPEDFELQARVLEQRAAVLRERAAQLRQLETEN